MGEIIHDFSKLGWSGRVGKFSMLGVLGPINLCVGFGCDKLSFLSTWGWGAYQNILSWGLRALHNMDNDRTTFKQKYFTPAWSPPRGGATGNFPGTAFKTILIRS